MATRLPPSKEMDKYLSIVKKIVEESQCKHYQRGALIVKNNEIVSSASSGAPTGCISCSDRENMYLHCPLGDGNFGCFYPCAAIYAISKAAKNGIELKGATIYLSKNTLCSICFPAIIEAGITVVIAEKDEYPESKIYRMIKSYTGRVMACTALAREAGIILIRSG